MKVKVYFDNAEERYKIYNGDTVINATEVTINEVAIDEQLSDTSANAVENRAVKKALDDNKSYSQEIVGSLNDKVDANKSDTDNKVGTLNSRLDEVIGQGMRLIKGTDISWTWGPPNYGISSGFQLPANTVIFVAIPKNCYASVKLNDTQSISIYDFGNLEATDTQVGMFVTGENITDEDTFYIGIDVASDVTTEVIPLVEANTTLLIADSPQELKDIRVDYYGTIHDTAGDSVRYGMQLQKQTQDEVEDVRVDAYGLEHASAGDSVRSIMEAIETGEVNINNTINWTENTTEYTGSAIAEAYLPPNQKINIILPAETIINIGTTELGDITATETQELVFSNDNNTTYDITLNSNSLTYDTLIESIKLYMDFNIGGIANEIIWSGITPQVSPYEDYVISKNGNAWENNPTYYKHCTYILPIGGVKIKFSGKGYNASYPAIIWLDEDNSVIGYYGETNDILTDVELTLPENAYKVIINGVNNTKFALSYEKRVRILIDDYNKLNGKKISINGDSIAYGQGYLGGVLKLIANNYKMTLDNVAVAGGTLTSGSSTSVHHICDTLDTMANDSDYYIIMGGYNDYLYDTNLLGSITQTMSDEINKNTVYGALELICRTLLTTYPTKKIGFIITHKILNSAYTNKKFTMQELHDAIVEVCKKYSISYCDLFELSQFNTELELFKNYTLNKDGVHPTKDGYELFYYPHVENWLKSL